MDKDEFEFYDKAAMAVTDAAGAIEFAEEKGMKKGEAKGRKEGIKEGREEGEKKKAIEMAVNAIKKGFSVELVSELTGLSAEHIKSCKLLRILPQPG